MKFYKHRNGSTVKKNHGIGDQFSGHNRKQFGRIPKPKLAAAETAKLLKLSSTSAQKLGGSLPL